MKDRQRKAIKLAEKVASVLIEKNDEIPWRISMDYGLGGSYRKLASLYEKEITDITGMEIGTSIMKGVISNVIKKAGHYTSRQLKIIGERNRLNNLIVIGSMTGRHNLPQRSLQEMVDDAHSSHIKRGIVPPAIAYNHHRGETEEEYILRVLHRFNLTGGRVDAIALAGDVNKPKNFGRFPGRKARTPLQISKFLYRIRKKTSKPI